MANVRKVLLFNSNLSFSLNSIALPKIKPYFLGFEMKAVITSPAPMPMKMDATNNNADVLRNINPTPTPISVVPPMAHELLSLLSSTSISSSIYSPPLTLWGMGCLARSCTYLLCAGKVPAAKW